MFRHIGASHVRLTGLQWIFLAIVAVLVLGIFIYVD